MRLHLTFKNIVDNPKCRIYINQQLLAEGTVEPSYEFNIDLDAVECCLRIDHWDKNPSDTIVENGKIIRDRSFELEKIIIDGYDLQELIWQSSFVSSNSERYESCLFFGPNGSFELSFHLPILHWILSNRNESGWEEDYNHYQTACQLLKQI
jgi:hypothetical protein